MKKLIPIIVFMFAVLFCVACTVPANDYDSKIKELEQKIASQQQLIDEMQNKLDSDDEIEAELEKQKELNELYKKQFRNLTGKPIEFTAKAPIYGNKEEDETIVEYDSFTDNPYMAFENYYKENRPIADDYIYYVFRPDDYLDEKKVLIADNYTNRHYYLVKQDENFLVNEALIIYDEVFDDGTWDEELEDYAPSWKESFHLVFYMAPVEKYSEKLYDYKSFRLEFGQTDSGSTYFNMFINTYCIGTCYYQTNCYVSYTGFKEYLYDRLVTI